MTTVWFPPSTRVVGGREQVEELEVSVFVPLLLITLAADDLGARAWDRWRKEVRRLLPESLEG